MWISPRSHGDHSAISVPQPNSQRRGRRDAEWHKDLTQSHRVTENFSVFSDPSLCEAVGNFILTNTNKLSSATVFVFVRVKFPIASQSKG